MAKPDWGELQQRFLSEHAANRRFIDCPAASMPITSPDFLQKILGEKHANWLRKGVNK
ncbi:hypothetical protein M8Q32_16010 [Enterobacter hormaechei]|uniref:hypothetical protein n=1 Tax=Enterobacter hormaechei TaxID=158836 RepID=UPI001C9B7F4B|nr:hypothetical protein [Enterobacter hormaechei]EME8868201.1 hypothetical protein [Enterobacter hormaechei]MBY7197933.1 hypothetical protein [Enterobacter hormaechei]MCM7240520.1 hypothetical protein [Enterobacter hormaechei]MCM7248117.1 hypothetical protein [Enterobacter hormaechei]MCM7866313.1 hypothetical protein [Enterobacter hormaechei]